MPGKFILILLDGLGDRAYSRLGGLTPLQAAHTPYMDGLAAGGANGLFHASLQGQALPSENAHFAMLGYNQDDFPGRGALEALGTGIDLGKKDVAVLAHFVNVREENGYLRLVQDKVSVDKETAGQVFKEVAQYDCGNVSLELVRTKGLFGIAVLKGNVSPFVTDSNPVRDGQLLTRIRPWAGYEEHGPSMDTALALNRYLSWVYKKLEKSGVSRSAENAGFLPLNALVTQRAGRLKSIVPFSLKFGLNGASVSSGMVYAGLGRYLGLDVIAQPDIDDPGIEISRRIDTAAGFMDKYDFFHIHSKAPDEAAHKKDPLLKKKVIEQLDHGLGKSLPKLLARQDTVVAITSDHSTPSKGDMVHCGEPVPLTLMGSGVRIDQVKQFDEVSAAQGCLGFVRGREFMYMVLNYMDRGKLAGLMDTPHDQPYWPGKYQPFELI